MPSRFGPTVLPVANTSFATALEGLQRGYGLGEGILERRRQQREGEEDRNRYLRALRAREMAQPGATDLSTFLQTPGNKPYVDIPTMKRSPMGTPLTFTPAAKGRFFQEPETGAVVDREAARKQTLADALARYVPDYVRAGVSSPEALTQLDLARNPQRLVPGTKLVETAAQRHARAEALRADPANADLRNLGDDSVILIGDDRKKKLNPVTPWPPAPPRAPGPMTPAQRSTAHHQHVQELTHERDVAQRSHQAIYNEQFITGSGIAPPAVDTTTGQMKPASPRYRDWVRREQAARQVVQAKQDALDAAMAGQPQPRHPGPAARPGPKYPENPFPQQP